MSGVLESVHELKSAVSQTDYDSKWLVFLKKIEKVTVPLLFIDRRIQLSYTTDTLAPAERVKLRDGNEGSLSRCNES